MRLFPYSFDDFPLNDRVNLYAWFVDTFMWSLSSSNVGLVKRSGEYPAFGSVQFTEKTFSIKLVLTNPRTYRNTLTQRINTADRVRKTLKRLVAFDEDNGRIVYLDCFPVSLVCDDDYGKQFTVTFVAPNPEWKSTRTFIATKNLTASGQTLSITNNGNVPCDPVYKIKPKVQKASGYPYRMYFTVINKATYVSGRTPGAWTNRPVDITDGGWATNALVAAGKMRNDGYDLRTYVNNVEVNRWLDGMNTAATKVWLNLNELPYQTLLCNTTIPGAGSIATIAIKSPKSGSKYKLTGYPTQGILQIGTEQFYYNGLDIKNGIFTIKERNARGTTIAAHAVNDALYVITNDIVVIYGDASAEAPVVDDGFKPVINLNTSTNAIWYWDTANHFGSDDYPNRTGKWSYTNVTTYSESGVYMGAHVTDQEPFDVMGAQIQVHIKGTKYYAGNIDVSWTFVDPVGVTDVDMAGDYYKYASNSLWPVIRLYKEKTVQWTITSPVAYASWIAWTEHTIALGNTYYRLVLRTDGACAAIASNLIGFEANAVFVTFSATRKPVVSRSAEIGSTYAAYMTISNSAMYEGDTISESITIILPSMLNENIIVDTSTREVYKETDRLNAIPAVEKDYERLMWLPLYPGINTLTFTEAGLADVDIEVDYQEKFN